MMPGQGNVMGLGGPGNMGQQQQMQQQQQQNQQQQQQLMNQQGQQGGMQQQQQQQNHMMSTPDMRRTFDTLGLNAAGGIAQNAMAGGPGQVQMGFGVGRMPGPGSTIAEMGNGPQMNAGMPTCPSPQQGVMAGNRVSTLLH